MKTYANEPITLTTIEQDQWAKFSGLTKREYFALHIMSGDLANQSNETGIVTKDRSSKLHQARRAVEMADCLIDALNEKTHQKEQGE